MKLIEKCQPGSILNKQNIRNKRMSLQDYITQRIQDKRDSAMVAMDNKITSVPIEKRVPKEHEVEMAEEILFNARRQADLNYINLLNAYNSNEQSSLIDAYKKNYLDSQARVKIAEKRLNAAQDSKDEYITVSGGPNCLYTYTDNYGKDRRVSGNQTWLTRGKSGKYVYEEKGFKKLPKDAVLQPSDLVQTVQGMPIHAVMFNGYQNNNTQDEDQVIDASYSNGTVGDNSMRHQVKYPYHPGRDNAFRFVGNAADSARWTREYNELYNKLANYKVGGKLIKRKLW